jgi:hypothetical protein
MRARDLQKGNKSRTTDLEAKNEKTGVAEDVIEMDLGWGVGMGKEDKNIFKNSL